MATLAPLGLSLDKILAAGQAFPTMTVVIVLSMYLVRPLHRLLAEWQRRLTLDHILSSAPEGTVIVQENSKAGSAMCIWVGAGPHGHGKVGE